jgi:hypothetical protein
LAAYRRDEWVKGKVDEMKVDIQEYGLLGENDVVIPIGAISNGVVKIGEDELNPEDVDIATYRGIKCRGCLELFNLALPLPLCYTGAGPYNAVAVSGHHREVNFNAKFNAVIDRRGVLRFRPGYTSMPGTRGVRLQFVFKPEIKPVNEGADVIYAKSF